MDPWAPEEGAQHGSRLLAKASRRRQEAGVKGCSTTLLEICAPALKAPQSESDYEHLVAVLDKILDAGGADEASPLATLADAVRHIRVLDVGRSGSRNWSSAKSRRSARRSRGT